VNTCPPEYVLGTSGALSSAPALDLHPQEVAAYHAEQEAKAAAYAAALELYEKSKVQTNVTTAELHYHSIRFGLSSMLRPSMMPRILKCPVLQTKLQPVVLLHTADPLPHTLTDSFCCSHFTPLLQGKKNAPPLPLPPAPPPLVTRSSAAQRAQAFVDAK
jgi:hypothetical protein